MFAALLLPLLPLATAHYSIAYPHWRGDSFTTPGASQWLWPCANVSQDASANNRTLWPLTGGSLVLNAHHPWAPTYVNLGLGNAVTSFNVSLVSQFNQTGNGTFCLPAVGRAQLEQLGVQDGMNASIQVVQITARGNALYNCADITFSAAAQPLGGDRCANGTGVAGAPLQNAAAADGSAAATATPTPTPTPTRAAGAAGGLRGRALGLGPVVVGVAGLLVV